MAAPGYVVGLRNAQLDAIATAIGTSAKLRIYSGTRPATGGTATTLLVELICSASAFAAAASSGVLTANAISSGTAVATGTASWARILKSDGTTVEIDMDVGTSGTSIILATTSIVSGATVSISSLTITRGNP
jgi:hypothetical protein